MFLPYVYFILDIVQLEKNIHQFFLGYTEGRFDSYRWPQLLKLNDWPPSGLFDEQLPRHGAEFSSCLPFMEYTHPQYGYLNLALRLPDNCGKPDLGPKAYIAYGFPEELGRGDSVTKLHYVMTDTVCWDSSKCSVTSCWYCRDLNTRKY